MLDILKSFSIKVWKDGKCLDLWSINHTLAGGLLAAVIFFNNINLYLGFLISLALMIAWEIIEIIKNIYEEKCNKIMDVVTGIFGFILIYFIFLKINTNSALTIFWIMTGCWVFLETWGFVTFRIK
jgi:hypothetical protein